MATLVCLGRSGAQPGNHNGVKMSTRKVFLMNLLKIPWRITRQTINIHNLAKASNLMRRQHTESAVRMKTEDGYFCTKSISLEGFGPVQPKATQERSHNPSEDKRQADCPSILLLALRGETPAECIRRCSYLGPDLILFLFFIPFIICCAYHRKSQVDQSQTCCTTRAQLTG